MTRFEGVFLSFLVTTFVLYIVKITAFFPFWYSYSTIKICLFINIIPKLLTLMCVLIHFRKQAVVMNYWDE